MALYIYRNNRKLQAALTASQEAREALRLSEERHRFLADNVSDVILTMDLHAQHVREPIGGADAGLHRGRSHAADD